MVCLSVCMCVCVGACVWWVGLGEQSWKRTFTVTLKIQIPTPIIIYSDCFGLSCQVFEAKKKKKEFVEASAFFSINGLRWHSSVVTLCQTGKQNKIKKLTKKQKIFRSLETQLEPFLVSPAYHIMFVFSYLINVHVKIHSIHLSIHFPFQLCNN